MKAWLTGVTVPALLFAMSRVASADGAAPKPLLFYQVFERGQYAGGDTTETDDHGVQAAIHDRLTPLLASLFGTQIVAVDLGNPDQRQLATACRERGAVGAFEVRNVWQVDRSYRSVAIVQVTPRNCTGTSWFTVDGGTVSHSTIEGVLGDITTSVLNQVKDKLTRIVHDTPNATANFVRYGMYMNDAEADSLWTLQISGAKTVVDSCDTAGTAYRAGLRMGDEVLAIDGTATTGVDQAQLNAIMENAKRRVPWVITVRRRDGSTRSLRFRNETVAWYAANPAP